LSVDDDDFENFDIKKKNERKLKKLRSIREALDFKRQSDRD